MLGTVSHKLEEERSKLDDWPQLHGIRAAVIGLGALGSQLVPMLGDCGIGQLLVVDHDRVEVANLARDAMYAGEDVGEPKATAMERRCRERFPDMRVESAAVEVADLGWGRFEHCDVLFGCVDRDSARLETARIATRLGIPVCDGGLNGKRGRVSWFGEACFCCRLTAARRRRLLREWRSQAHPCGVSDEAPGITGMSPAALATSVLMLGTAGAGLRKWGSFSLEIGTPFERIALARSPECPFHEPVALAAVPGTFADALAGCDALSWEWPICTLARCPSCGKEWRPFVRTARMRDTACPACVCARPLVLEAVRSITKASQWVEATPQQIGLPDHHLFAMHGGGAG